MHSPLCAAFKRCVPLLTVCPAAILYSAEPATVPLWPTGVPGFEARVAEPEVINTRVEPEYGGFPVTTNIHNPSLLVFRPAGGKANGAAVIIAPGGGHMFLTMGREGVEVAEWLRGIGVTALVLKYRLARAENSPYGRDACVEDGRRAIRLVRSRATEWGVDPARVGIMGFSAGGRVALFTAIQPQAGVADAADVVERQSARPDFMMSIYGEIPREFAVPADAPPAFLLVAGDDNPKVAGLVDAYLKWRAAGVPAELHVFNSGGHGFGIADRPFPIAQWPARLHEWMRDRRLLEVR